MNAPACVVALQVLSACTRPPRAVDPGQLLEAIRARLDALRRHDLDAWSRYVADDLLTPLEGPIPSKQALIKEREAWPPAISYYYGCDPGRRRTMRRPRCSPLRRFARRFACGSPQGWPQHTTAEECIMKVPGAICIGHVTLLMFASIASAETFSGVLCNVHNNNPNAGYNVFGIHNASTSAALSVECGGVTSGAVRSVTITAYDRSPSDDVRCTVFLTNAGGGALFSTILSTSGFASGAFTLTAAVPSIVGNLVLECSIPALNAQNGASHVTTYSIQ